MITETFENHGISLADCRAQGYDSAEGMSGKYNGAQAMTKEQYPIAMFSPCGCHTIYMVMMLLNVFQKQSPTSELYRKYTSYSVAAA